MSGRLGSGDVAAATTQPEPSMEQLRTPIHTQASRAHVHPGPHNKPHTRAHRSRAPQSCCSSAYLSPNSVSRGLLFSSFVGYTDCVGAPSKDVASRYSRWENFFVAGQKWVLFTTFGRASEHLVTIPSTHTMRPSRNASSCRGDTCWEPKFPSNPSCIVGSSFVFDTKSGLAAMNSPNASLKAGIAESGFCRSSPARGASKSRSFRGTGVWVWRWRGWGVDAIEGAAQRPHAARCEAERAKGKGVVNE